MNQSLVVFKGVKGGLKVYINGDGDIEQIVEDLEKKIKGSRQFFGNSQINLIFTGKRLTLQEQQNIVDLISREIEVGSITFEMTNPDIPAADYFEFFDGIDEGMTRFVRGTVRNGQRIYYEGNVVVIGDVNPGGEIIAGGNILVMGTLRGVAHAGATGNHNAVVVAFSLQPTQLRIGGIIARPPEDESVKPSYPEIAYVKDNILVIEPYLPGKGK
ncbi:septum site-determining protein MinC [Caldicoprobacter guelmensis]|uniref:septum site-determining protein MinC n=1 Tax=Caldicoprobacter guelmensis TaxID=1170224 RepID=UPI00195DCBB0|nr:septum site-determining protein MinC [Caldicoprobacter guelmensis]MBM7583065.1 septum site-determining protein MinC [Caldicoprobacter guelmensis]